MKAVLHIGTPKSGTTTIQAFLAINAPALAAQGIRYQRYDPVLTSQLELALVGKVGSGRKLNAASKQAQIKARSQADQQAYVARYLDWLRARTAEWPEPVFLGSSEQLYALLTHKSEVEALHRAFSAIFDEVRYIVYFRPQAEYLLSSYSERLKTGERISLDTHLDQRIDKVNYFQRAKMWAEVVGADALDVRLLDPGFLSGGDLLDDFCGATGIDRTRLADPPRLNNALSAEMVKWYLRMGRVMPLTLGSGRRNWVALGLLAAIERFVAPGPGTRLALSAEQRARIEAAHAQSNERLRRRWFPDRTTLFTPR